jgi:hypothetical protein
VPSSTLLWLDFEYPCPTIPGRQCSFALCPSFRFVSRIRGGKIQEHFDDRPNPFSISKTGDGPHIRGSRGGNPPFSWYSPHSGVQIFEVEVLKNPLKLSGFREADSCVNARIVIGSSEKLWIALRVLLQENALEIEHSKLALEVNEIGVERAISLL